MDGFDLFIDGSIRLCGQEQEDSPFPPYDRREMLFDLLFDLKSQCPMSSLILIFVASYEVKPFCPCCFRITLNL